MHNLDDFKTHFKEPEKKIKPEDLPYPKDFLAGVYLFTTVGLLLIILVYILHLQFPGF